MKGDSVATCSKVWHGCVLLSVHVVKVEISFEKVVGYCHALNIRMFLVSFACQRACSWRKIVVAAATLPSIVIPETMEAQALVLISRSKLSRGEEQLSMARVALIFMALLHVW